MNSKKRLANFIRGWLPKAPSLPSNQGTRVASHLMRLQPLRVAYGVMLGALLFTPFGVYHSRVEPYITGYLWGYHLPIGYVGVLLGIVAVLYPRLNALRRLRFSSFMPFIGLFLLLSFFFSPKDYFINLIHGTNFSPAEIDVDFAVGNSAVLGLSLLSIAFGLVSFIRGWLPKEPHSSGYQRTTNHKPPKIGLQIGIVTFVMGLVGGLLGAFASSLGLFSALGVYVCAIIIVVGITIVAATIIIRKKQKEEQQRS
jgi:MFS family permease